MPDFYVTRGPRANRTSTRVTPWLRYRLIILTVVMIAICLILHNYLTHPGLHVAGATALLDVILARYWFSDHHNIKRSAITLVSFAAILVLANILGIIAVLLNDDDPFAMTIGTMEGCLSVLLLLFRKL